MKIQNLPLMWGKMSVLHFTLKLKTNSKTVGDGERTEKDR